MSAIFIPVSSKILLHTCHFKLDWLRTVINISYTLNIFFSVDIMSGGYHWNFSQIYFYAQLIDDNYTISKNTIALYYGKSI